MSSGMYGASRNIGNLPSGGLPLLLACYRLTGAYMFLALIII